MSGWDAFRQGLARALHHPELLAVMFAVNLLTALLLAVLPAVGLASTLGHRPALQEAADGVDAWLLLETLTAPMADQALGLEGYTSDLTRLLRQAGLLGLFTILALPLLAWLSGALLGGGVLLVFAEAPQPFRWRRFLWGCWHWFGSFLLLSLVQAAVSAPVLGIGAAVVVVAAGRSAFLWVVVVLLGLFLAAWLVLFELARAGAVARGNRNPIHALGGAVRLLFRRPLQVSGLYGLALFLLAAVHGLFRWGLTPRLPLTWWLLVLVVQQAFMLARLGARLARMAGAVALASGAPVRGSALARGEP